MYNTILVPVDGSKRAEAILPHVEELARRYRARVILLQVIEPAPIVAGPQGAYVALSQQALEQEKDRARSYLAALQAQFREKEIQAQTRIDYGPVVGEIINAAKDEDVDLIALASHGRTGLTRVFYGSVAAGLLHRVDRPLLLIRSQGDE